MLAKTAGGTVPVDDGIVVMAVGTTRLTVDTASEREADDFVPEDEPIVARPELVVRVDVVIEIVVLLEVEDEEAAVIDEDEIVVPVAESVAVDRNPVTAVTGRGPLGVVDEPKANVLEVTAEVSNGAEAVVMLLVGSEWPKVSIKVKRRDTEVDDEEAVFDANMAELPETVSGGAGTVASISETPVNDENVEVIADDEGDGAVKNGRGDDECIVAVADEDTDADSDSADPLEALLMNPSSSSRRTPGRGCEDETDCSRCLSGPAAAAPVSRKISKAKKAICMMKIFPTCGRSEGKSDERRDRIEKGAGGVMGVSGSGQRTTRRRPRWFIS